jgi:hypothetical protein
LYGLQVYDASDLQTIVSATSSISSVTPLVYRQIPVTISATSTITALGGMRFSGDGTATSSSIISSVGVRYRESGATITASSATVASSTATYSDSASITVTSNTSANAEAFYLERSDKFAYGSGLYGLQVYDEADLQTIVSSTSVSSTASCERLRLVGATTNVAATVTSSSEKINLGSALSSSTVSTSVTGLYVFSVQGLINANATTALNNIIRVRNVESLVSANSPIFSIAREKWEAVSLSTNVWNTMSVDSSSWGAVSVVPKAWAGISNNSNTWVKTSETSRSWGTMSLNTLQWTLVSPTNSSWVMMSDFTNTWTKRSENNITWNTMLEASTTWTDAA